MRIRFKNQFVYYGSARVDSMLKSFFAEISSRPSCYKCRFKSVERCSDFTIYDCWHANNLVEGLVDDDKGFTNLIVQSLKGERILDRIADRYELYATNLEKAIELDGTMICNSAEPHPRRDEYYLNLDKETLRAHIQKFVPIRIRDYLIEKKKPMSELAAPLKIYPQVLENVRVTDKKAAQNDPAVQEAVSKVAEALGDTGRILVRESGTEPVVRVMVEAPDHDTCQKYVDEVVNVICEKGYKV